MGLLGYIKNSHFKRVMAFNSGDGDLFLLPLSVLHSFRLSNLNAVISFSMYYMFMRAFCSNFALLMEPVVDFNRNHGKLGLNCISTDGWFL